MSPPDEPRVSTPPWAGVPLINRQRDGRVLTDAGAQFHKRISLALQEIAQASADLLVIRGNHLLRIWCMPGLALHWLTARLPHFQALHPEVELSLRPSERSPDFANHEAEVDIHYLYGDPQIDPAGVSGMARRVRLACLRCDRVRRKAESPRRKIAPTSARAATARSRYIFCAWGIVHAFSLATVALESRAHQPNG
jgi:DNA-binding transcriptional LysR family regulator